MKEIVRKNKIFDILKIHLKYILIVYILVIIGSVVFYIVSPKYYRATTEILKPIETTQTNISSEVLLSILNSNGMLDKIVKNFGLSVEYGTQNLDILRDDLKKNIKISEVGHKIIKIDVIDRNPKTAAGIANFFCENLNKILYNLTTASATQNRISIKKNIKKISGQLNVLEDKTNKIEKKSNIIIINNGTEGLSSISDYLMGRLIKEKLTLQIIKQTEPTDTKKIAKTKIEIADLEKQIDEVIGYKKSLSNLQKNISTKEAILSSLNKQLEESRISESKNILPIQVLDKAVVPTTIYKPDIKILMLIDSCVILGIGLLIIFFDALRFLGSL